MDEVDVISSDYYGVEAICFCIMVNEVADWCIVFFLKFCDGLASSVCGLVIFGGV